MQSSERPSISEVLNALGGDVVPKEYGWTDTRCILPGHADNRPSARLNEEKCWYWCPVCSFSGDAYTLVKEVEGLDGFPAQVARVQELTGFVGDQVRGGSHGSSYLMAGGKGDSRKRRPWTPPWLRSKTGAGA